MTARMTPSHRERRGPYSFLQHAEPCIQLYASDGAAAIGRVGLCVHPSSKKTRELDCAELVGLGVATSHRGRGIGTRLVREAEAVARLLGRSRVGATVGLENTQGRALFDRLGYRATRFRSVSAGTRLVEDNGVTHEEDVLGDYIVKDL